MEKYMEINVIVTRCMLPLLTVNGERDFPIQRRGDAILRNAKVSSHMKAADFVEV